MAITLASLVKNAQLDTVRKAVDGLLTSSTNTSPGKLRLYSGTRPATADTAVGTGNVLLAELPFQVPSAPAAASGILTFSTPIQVAAAVASGTAAWARFVDFSGATILDAAAGAAGSGAELILSSTAVTQNGAVSVTSLTLTA